MKTIRIYGASDDLIEVEGDIEDEFGAYDGGALKIVAQPAKRRVEVEGQNGTFLPDIKEGLFVNGVYGVPKASCGGCWGFSVHQLEEDVPLPPWDIKILPESKAYSTVIEMTVPDDVEITLVGAEEEDED